MALSFCSRLACADTMCAVWSCRVRECFLGGKCDQPSHDGMTFLIEEKDPRGVMGEITL